MKRLTLLGITILCLLLPAQTLLAFAPAPPPPPPPPQSDPEPAPGARVDRVYAPGGKGYLEYIITDSGHKQPFLHLEGSGYEMGYQQGYLIPEKCKAVAAKEFYLDLGTSMVGGAGIPVEPLLEPMAETILEFLGLEIPDHLDTPDTSPADLLLFAFKKIAVYNQKYIPREYLDEMRGIADGAKARGFDLSYEDVLLLNIGFDAFLSAGYPIMVSIVKGQEILGGLNLSCNAHILDGNATVTDNLYFGRDFMFGGKGFSDHPVIIETRGDGGRNRMVNVTVAGMVGCIAGMNEKGLGIGMDMIPAMDCVPGDVGMGTLLTSRWVMEQADELPQAVSMIGNSKRGAPWIYAIADGQGANRGGVSLEVSAHYYKARYLNHYQNSLLPLIYNVDQQETYSDALIQTNHYVTWKMQSSAVTYQDASSVSRYDSMIDLLQQDYGTYDYNKAFDFINWMYHENNQGPGDQVRQSTTLFDLTNLKMTTLAGPTFGEGATTYQMP
ncbi:MAG: C45 family autoproteolytic acyltransferase/hydrolase [Desulfosudaceae bacterium]